MKKVIKKIKSFLLFSLEIKKIVLSLHYAAIGTQQKPHTMYTAFNVIQINQAIIAILAANFKGYELKNDKYIVLTWDDQFVEIPAQKVHNIAIGFDTLGNKVDVSDNQLNDDYKKYKRKERKLLWACEDILTRLGLEFTPKAFDMDGAPEYAFELADLRINQLEAVLDKLKEIELIIQPKSF